MRRLGLLNAISIHLPNMVGTVITVPAIIAAGAWVLAWWLAWRLQEEAGVRIYGQYR